MIATPTALLLVAGLSVWSWYALPPQTRLARLQANVSQSWAMGDTGSPTDWWRLHLRIDASLPRVPGWVLREGNDEKPGYELRWDRACAALRLYRAHPLHTADPPRRRLLAVLHLTNDPRRVMLQRHGHCLTVLADGHRITLVDPLPAPPAEAWRFLAHEDMGASYLTIHRDNHLRTDPACQPDAPTVIDQVAAVIRTDRFDHAAREELARTEASVAALPANDTRAHLRAWLAWSAALRHLIPHWRDAEAHQRLEAAIAPLLADDRALAAGLLVDLLPDLFDHALRHPDIPTPAAEWIAHRHQALGLIATCAERASDHDDALPVITRHELLLLAQAARTLSARSPDPVPAQAPAWVTIRWRLLAGIPLATEEVARPESLPPLPEPFQDDDRLRLCLGRALAAAQFDQIRLRNICARIRQALTDRKPALALLAAKDYPPRERALAIALLSLRGVVGSDEAQQALGQGDTAGNAWIERDPLAYALSRLLGQRRPVLSFFPRLLPDPPPTEPDLPTSLQLYQGVLCGKPRATLLVFGNNPDNLLPAQVLASALAMQEVAGLEPAWSLLSAIARPILPLELCIPPSP